MMNRIRGTWRSALHSYPNSRGFTLIEIIVALSIFTIVVLVTVGSILSINDANRKAQGIRVVMDNMNFALENIGRKLREGGQYYCVNDYSGASIGEQTRDCDEGNSIVFKVPNGDMEKQIAYTLREGRILIQDGFGADFEALTSPDIEIERLSFRVSGAGPDDGLQPKVIMTVAGRARAGSLETEFNLETAISERLLDS